MEKNISAELPGQFPFDILIRSKEGKFARTKALNDRNLKLGICIQNRAWLLVRLPTDQSAPEKFLQTLKDITGLPLLYPEHEDFQHLREAYPKAQNVFDLLIQAENLNTGRRSSQSMARFSDDEEEIQNAYFQKPQKISCYIRFVVDLDLLF